MHTPTVGLSRFTAALCAAVITAASAWAFVNSTASTDRDPFRFAAVMAANAKVRAAHLPSRDSTHICRDDSRSSSRPCVAATDLKASASP
jgi:hypothetical protein